MADAEVIQLGSRGPAGRGSRTSPSAAGGPPPGPEDMEGSPTEPAQPGKGGRPRMEPPDPAEAPPDEAPPTHSLGAVLSELVGTLQGAIAGLSPASFAPLRGLATDPWQTLATLAGRVGVEWPWSVEETVAFARSRLTGDYAVDQFGFDPEFTTKIFLPLLRPLVQTWFRVEVRGGENLPTSGSALLVSNHAGTLPLDGMILQTVVYDEIARHVRMLGADLIFKTPYSHDLARKTGTTLACQEDAERLLAGDQLVAVFPEGFKGLGKPYADRYKLQRFGRGGFVSAAVRAQVPIIPVSIVGSEEIYPLLSSAPVLARALGVPYFPITPLFPWLGLLGLVPLPSKWMIEFGEAVTTDELPPGAAEDPMVVFDVTDQVRETIQHTLYECLTQRRSAFF
ncbi:MAG TPA: lysophospholipid acyltransferase family protein [Propionibacteriaceae bacterium]|nr:lysophospholipid acyltransferase family protein [Propionibacteriaceae bacterium]